MFKQIIQLVFCFCLVACNAGSNNRNELDSLLKSEDSIRMQNDLDFSVLNLNEVIITNDPDIDFARLMQLYYSSGLRAAEIELRTGKNAEVIAVAKEQQKHHSNDIGLLDDYIHNQQPKLSDPGFVSDFYALLKKRNETVGTSDNFDTQYLYLLIRHHEEAIELCELYLKHGSDPYLKLRANHIISEHKPETVALKNLLSKASAKS